MLADDVEETGDVEDDGEAGARGLGEEDGADGEEKDGAGEGFIGGVKSEFLVKTEGGASLVAEPKHAGDVKPGQAVPAALRMTTMYMTKYERARILGSSLSAAQRTLIAAPFIAVHTRSLLLTLLSPCVSALCSPSLQARAPFRFPLALLFSSN